jgi:hypothetical protein
MIKHTCGSHKRFRLRVAVVAMMLTIFCFFPAFSWSRPIEFSEGHRFKNMQKCRREMLMVKGKGLYSSDKRKDYEAFNSRRPYLLLTRNHGRNYNRLSPEEKTMLQRRLREWESMSPERKRILRHRMEEYNRMPPGERHRFRQRYQRWQKLTPNERNRIQQKLRQWDKLPPSEKEQIRRRFREP